tara:strand:+ start:3829 stop:4404 length:576 start_codon:yes stop_codon:yes gene_type:complete
MSEGNVLKKEFGKKDVTRLRNLVSGKYSEKNGQSVGYSKADSFYGEGDIWEENGRKWTIKDGIKQNITKLDKVKKAHLVPLFCPKCKKVMNKGMDPSYYMATDQCFKCFKKFETQLKVTGLWDEWNNKTINGNIDSFIVWYKDWVMDAIDTSNTSFVSEQGDVEKWDGGVNKAKALESLNKTIIEWEQARK